MSSLIKSTGVVALSTFMSRIMGFVREMLFANYFGASGSTDAFFVAFRIPNLLRRFVAEGALTISFIPVYTEYLVNKGEDEALKLAQKAINLTRVMFPYIFLVSLVAYAMGFLNSHNRFFTPAFSPVLLNVSIVFGILFISRFFVEPLYGVAIGVIIGGFIQVLIQIPLFLEWLFIK